MNWYNDTLFKKCQHEKDVDILQLTYNECRVQQHGASLNQVMNGLYWK